MPNSDSCDACCSATSRSAARVLDSCGVSLVWYTSHITRTSRPPRIGCGREATGVRPRAEAWPSVWLVLELSKPQIGGSAPSVRILVFDRSLAVGRVPSIQMYSALYRMVVLVGVGASGDQRKVGEVARGGLVTGVVGLQEVGDGGVLGSPGVGQRGTSPAVGGLWPGPGAEQESDCGEVSLGGGQVQ